MVEVLSLAHHIAQHLAVLFKHRDNRAVVDHRNLIHRGADVLGVGDKRLLGALLQGIANTCNGRLLVLLLLLLAREVALDDKGYTYERSKIFIKNFR